MKKVQEDLGIFQGLTQAAKQNAAFSGLNDQELYQMIVMDVAQMTLDTVATKLKNTGLLLTQKYIMDEALKIVDELDANDFAQKTKRDIKEIIKNLVEMELASDERRKKKILDK